jgi:hypothetical protein
VSDKEPTIYSEHIYTDKEEVLCKHG